MIAPLDSCNRVHLLAIAIVLSAACESHFYGELGAQAAGSDDPNALMNVPAPPDTQTTPPWMPPQSAPPDLPQAGTAGQSAPPALPVPGWQSQPEPPPVTLEPLHVFTDAERELYGTLSPLPQVPTDTTNRYADNPDAAALGQQLFFDPRYAGPLQVDSDLGTSGETGKVACVSCHWGPYMDDQRSMPRNVSTGTGHHSRNALPIINSSFYRVTNWAGRFSSLWEISLPVAESPVIMNSTRLTIAHHIFDNYRASYEAVFGALDPALGTDAVRFPPSGKPKPAATQAVPAPLDGAWEGMTDADRAYVNRIFVNYGKALQAYMRLLVSRNAPFDRFVAGDDAAIPESARRGLSLFVGRARCVSCHQGPHFSDSGFHNEGVPQVGPNVPMIDEGRNKDIKALLASPFNSAGAFSDDVTTGRLAGLTDPPPAETLGQFRTPSLRGVALTPPYMHSGQFETLWDVIEFYDWGGGEPAVGQRSPLLQPLHLSEQDKWDLVAFLETLTGDPVPDPLLHSSFEPPPTNW